MGDDWAGVVGALLSGPNMPLAKCRGKHHLFTDSEHEDDIEAAKWICAGCEEIEPCRRFAESLKPSDRIGVYAGVNYSERKPRKRKDAA